MPYIITILDPVRTNQSKYADEMGVLRYTADNSQVFPGRTGVRPDGSSRYAVNTAQEMRDSAVNFVSDRSDAFGEDRTALREYGYTYAHELAHDMSDRGGSITLADDWSIDIQHVTWDDLRTMLGHTLTKLDYDYGNAAKAIITAFNESGAIA